MFFISEYNLTTAPVRKLFFRYLFPSITSTLVTSIYVLADTVIIGNFFGDIGMYVLNINLPLYGVFFGVGYLLGVGGAVLMSSFLGMEDFINARYCFSISVFFAVVISVSLALMTAFFFQPIAFFLGADASSFNEVWEYGFPIACGAPLFVFSALLQTFVRNDKNPKLAMIAVIAGGVSNVILDLVFISTLDLGLLGIAIATLIGNAVTILMLAIHFFLKNCSLKLNFKIPVQILRKISARIFQNGFTPFLQEFSNATIVLLFNRQLIAFSGSLSVAVYGIISNWSIILGCLINGTANAAQPIISMNFGADKAERVLSLLRHAMITATIIATPILLLGLLSPELLVRFFLTPTEDIIAIANFSIRISFLGFLFNALNVISASFFTATLAPKKSILITLARGLVLPAVLLLLLPTFWGSAGIWFTIPTAEFLTLILSFGFLKKHRLGRKQKLLPPAD